MNRIQSKDHNTVSHKIDKIFSSSYENQKIIYCKMDIVGYHNFINLPANDVKNNFVKYTQFVLIFALVRRAILFSVF